MYCCSCSCSGRFGCRHRARHTTHVAARLERLRFHRAKHSACTEFRHVPHVISTCAAAAGAVGPPCACACAGDISSRHTGQTAPSSLPDDVAPASSRRRCWAPSALAAAARADHNWWNLSLARGPASTSGHVGVPTSRATWHGRSDCLHTHASSSDRPRTRSSTKRMCLHGTAGSGHVHAGVVASVTVYTFPVAPSTKKSAPARCSSRSWCCSARMMRFATRRVAVSSATTAVTDSIRSIVSAVKDPLRRRPPM
ncbi:hypothetical protein GUJ93_ZPchr0006g40917 [Zizania palustris]|uniref:Uncharacterized protein n=1 Tax=Zizania palustris TaxID=103762 RepID=A0A8J5W4E4_ZIZPA|nr:hypothetical protein GUJ93_ZPchr0006g40917 [Zizania palustris]